MTLHWHNVNVKNMSTLLHLHPTNAGALCWHIPLATNVSKRFIGRDGFHTHRCCRDIVHCDVTDRSRQVSTMMFSECFILICKQARNNLIKWKCLSMPFNKYTTSALWLFSYIFTRSFSRMSTPRCHEINVMTFDAECHEICIAGNRRNTNVMTLMSWDLENVTIFLFSGTGAWSSFCLSDIALHRGRTKPVMNTPTR